ncbi:MAG: 2-oxoglutarate dehydrogenase, E2 component, dihydrolipoamide succinyltransferase [Actinomycetia bacterium]|nr:2-oxoglutarate dehydrogenase, E2 component, dihydrolipoamide succinyltransferase [Actinomycetes bacterium]MCH9796188.1 2-oxoglutarate dehydrogenase, E2 component, dihydrolipoamide succinyltransferase [Actinomycetes bacterium]
MPVTVTMPQLGESVTEGTITRWLKAVGDTVAADEPLLEVSTDKVDTEIPAPASGVLLSIDATEDDTVEVGGVLAVIGEPDDAAAVPSSEPSEPSEPVVADTPAEPAAPAEAAPSEPATPEPATPGPATPGPAIPEPVSSGSEVSVVLPALGESVTEGVITRWLKSVGDAVDADEPLVEISTDKVDTEIPAPVSGTLAAIAADTDATVEVGAEIARISIGASTPAPTAAPAPAAPAAPEASTPAPSAAEPGTPGAGSSDLNAGAYVTPLVRRLAAQHDIDLSTVTGSGVGGRIRKADVLAAVEARGGTTAQPAQPSLQQPAAPAAPAATPAPAATATATATAEPSALRGRTEKISRLRRVIAERMVESLQTSAQLTTVVEVDVTRIAALRGRIKADFELREGVKLSFLPFFCKAAVEALKVYPQINSSIDMDAGIITYHDSENLGIAVDTDRGLLVPVVRDAGDLNIAGIARRIADLAERTRTNKVGPDEVSGGTFTVTNTGSRGALFDTPIINMPQVAILGTGSVVKRPVVISDDGQDVIAIRSMVYLSLSYDHRIVDGADAARFLSTVKSRLEEGAFDAELGA